MLFILLRCDCFIRCILVGGVNLSNTIIEAIFIDWVQPSLILKSRRKNGYIKTGKILIKLRLAACSTVNLKMTFNFLAIFVAIYQINEKYDVITETGDSMSGWHCYYKCEYVVDKCIEGLIHECTPRQCGYRFHFIVDEQLRQHEQKSECVDTVYH